MASTSDITDRERRTFQECLDWITTTALAKDRRKRYQTARELAEDVEEGGRRFLMLRSPRDGSEEVLRVVFGWGRELEERLGASR